VSFVAITLCVASQRVFIVVYFVIDSVRKLLDTTSYYRFNQVPHHKHTWGSGDTAPQILDLGTRWG
jgi:hypothetical protein